MLLHNTVTDDCDKSNQNHTPGTSFAFAGHITAVWTNQRPVSRSRDHSRPIVSPTRHTGCKFKHYQNFIALITTLFIIQIETRALKMQNFCIMTAYDEKGARKNSLQKCFFISSRIESLSCIAFLHILNVLDQIKWQQKVWA